MESEDPVTVAVGALVVGAAATATSVYESMNAPSMPDAPALPTKSPDNTTAAAYAEAQAMRKRQGSSSTILTSPLGVQSQPTVTKQALGA